MDQRFEGRMADKVAKARKKQIIVGRYKKEQQHKKKARKKTMIEAYFIHC
jgi:hypothetical protein